MFRSQVLDIVPEPPHKKARGKGMKKPTVSPITPAKRTLSPPPKPAAPPKPSAPKVPAAAFFSCLKCHKSFPLLRIFGTWVSISSFSSIYFFTGSETARTASSLSLQKRPVRCRFRCRLHCSREGSSSAHRSSGPAHQTLRCRCRDFADFASNRQRLQAVLHCN